MALLDSFEHQAQQREVGALDVVRRGGAVHLAPGGRQQQRHLCIIEGLSQDEDAEPPVLLGGREVEADGNAGARREEIVERL